MEGSNFWPRKGEPSVSQPFFSISCTFCKEATGSHQAQGGHPTPSPSLGDGSTHFQRHATTSRVSPTLLSSTRERGDSTQGWEGATGSKKAAPRSG